VPGYQTVQFVKAPYKVWNLESRFQSNYDGFYNFMVGLYYYRGFSPVPVSQKSDQFFSPLTTPFLPINVDIYIPNLAKQYAGFTSQRFQITDKLKAELGLRYTIIKTYRQSFLTLQSPGNPGFGVPGFSSSTPTISAANTHTSNHPLTGGASLTYEVVPDTNVYFAYGRSYRGGNPAVGQTAQLDQSLIVSKSEQSNSFEVGVKSTLLNNRLQFNGDVFYQKFKNYLGRTDLVRFSSPRGSRLASRWPIAT
jgi:iron complex outermembrane receptor protein